MKRLLLFIAAGLLLSCTPKTSVTSPDGSIKLQFGNAGRFSRESPSSSSAVSLPTDGNYSIRDVVGADEYAQHVDDNAFTNGFAKLALRATVKAAGILGESVPDNWMLFAEGLVIPEKDDITLDYAGYDGQLTKQADPNLLAYPLGLITDPERILRDLEYYAPRIDSKDGQAMTRCIFAVQYAGLGDADKAYEFFRRSFEPNLH